MLCPSCGTEIPGDRPTCTKCGADPSLSPTLVGRTPGHGSGASLSFQPGESFAERYTIVEEIGSGGMGRVYKALDRQLGTTVALKLISPEAAARAGTLERFRREALLAQRVTHPNVCRMHDLGAAGNVQYISMEFIDGQNLRQWIQAVGHLSPAQTAGVAQQVCAGLEAIHQQSIVHRDLKPTNVMLDLSGRAVVMDFGLAYHPAADQVTAQGEVLGTLAYLSPEQARGEPTDAGTDVYALGLILFEMLTGRRPPADGKSLPLALRDPDERCPAPSEIVPEVPPELDALVLRCLERNPRRRFASASEVGKALGAVATSAIPRAVRQEGRARPVVRRWQVLAAAAALALGALLAYLLLPRPLGVAFLPLKYSGPDQNRYLANMLSLLMARELRASAGLKVAPFESSRNFASDEDMVSVAQQLGVDRILGGEIRVVDGSLSIALKLYTDRGQPIWSREYDSGLTAILDSTKPMAAEVAAALGSEPEGSAPGLPTERALHHYLEGKTYLEGWDVESNHLRAAEAFQEAIKEDEGFAEAHAALALSWWKHYELTGEAGFVERSLRQAERARALAPRLPEAHLALGVIQLGRGRSAEAAAAFERARQLAPADDGVCRRIADAYAELGRVEEAERMYQRAIDLRPGYWDSINRKAHFFIRIGRLAEAKELFRRVIELRPESDTGYANLAAAHILSGELTEAEPLLHAALQLKPTAWVHNNLGFVYYGTGRFEQAAGEFREAIEASGEHPEPHGNLADAYRQLKRTAEAREAYARAIELDQARLRVNPKDVARRAALAMHLAGAERCAESEKEQAQAEEDARAIPTVHYLLAVAQAICGDAEGAARHAARAIELGLTVDVRTNPDLKPLLDHRSIKEVLR